MASNFGGRNPLSIHEQLGRMRMFYPEFRARIEKGALVAIGDMRPTLRSVTYRVRLDYRVGQPPEITVLSPELKAREEGGRLPHVYPGNKLCLFLPNAGEWTADMSLPHTIMPWISEWLFYYELWLVTGEWMGGGVEPTAKKTIRREEANKPYERP
jgi:hypothetical protein